MIPRDQAERVLRRAIELEARHGELLSEDELAAIAREVDVHPEYVRRAIAEERAAQAGEFAVQGHAGYGPGCVPRHAASRRAAPYFVRVAVALAVGVALICGGITLVPPLAAFYAQISGIADAAGFVLAALMTAGLFVGGAYVAAVPWLYADDMRDPHA